MTHQEIIRQDRIFKRHGTTSLSVYEYLCGFIPNCVSGFGNNGKKYSALTLGIALIFLMKYHENFPMCLMKHISIFYIYITIHILYTYIFIWICCCAKTN